MSQENYHSDSMKNVNRPRDSLTAETVITGGCVFLPFGEKESEK